MKLRLDWQAWLGLALVTLSVAVYLVHYAIFRDAHHIFIYLIGDIAFVFLEVLLVTLILHRLLSHREKRVLLRKLNMVIGAFFSEVGTELIRLITVFDPESSKISQKLIVNNDWSHREFSRMHNYLKNYDYDIDYARGDLEGLRAFLMGKRDFLLALLENPNLLEHETFTNLLWAVFHLTEELTHRIDFRETPQVDRKHLAGGHKASIQPAD